MKLTPPNITPGPWSATTGAYHNADNAPDGSLRWAVDYRLHTGTSKLTNDTKQDCRSNATAIAALPQCLGALASLAQWCTMMELGGQFPEIGMGAKALSDAKAALIAAGYKIEE